MVPCVSSLQAERQHLKEGKFTLQPEEDDRVDVVAAASDQVIAKIQVVLLWCC